MAKKKSRKHLGIDAIVSFQCKFIHPHRYRDEKFPNPATGQKLRDARVVRRALKKINGEPTLCTVVNHEDFKDKKGSYIEIWCGESRVTVQKEGDPSLFFEGSQQQDDGDDDDDHSANALASAVRRRSSGNDDGPQIPGRGLDGALDPTTKTKTKTKTTKARARKPRASTAGNASRAIDPNVPDGAHGGDPDAPPISLVHALFGLLDQGNHTLQKAHYYYYYNYYTCVKQRQTNTKLETPRRKPFAVSYTHTNTHTNTLQQKQISVQSLSIMIL
mmetsp:Transcript_32146/g.75603  ORF Transcript_32146/g.75603 Transcript_32146/m.75603 type:complete len:274 (+) Transcript_32146:140-961(+)